jgi:MYXO-CTERM domain-containing protein
LQCTPAFIDNPVWSPTQPVIADKLGLPANATVAQAMATIQSGTQNYQVTIPAAAHCSMATPCTLQVLMIMTDHTFPSCNYHHCANMALAGGATGTGGSTGTADAGTHDGSAGAGGKTGAGGGPATGMGGAPATGTGGAPSSGAGGSTTAGTGGTTTGAGTGGAMASEGGSSGGGQDSGTGGSTGSDNGCSCATGGSVGGASGAVLLIALLALKGRRRKSSS